MFALSTMSTDTRSTTHAKPAPTPSGAMHQALVTKQPTSFQFLTFEEPGRMKDAAALTRIRRHAMKDIGLQRRKPKKKRYLEVSLDVPSTESWAREESPQPIIPAIGGGGIHTFFKLPIDINHDSLSKSLLANIWRDDPLDTTSRQTAHRADWFSVSLTDPSTFNQVLANSELHLEAARNPSRLPRETQTSIRYHQLAVSAIRQQMGLDPGNVTEAMIGAVSGFVVYAEISGVLEWWLPQRKGLVDLILSKPGGTTNSPHLTAACSWVELRGCYMQDIPPLLPLPQKWVDAFDLEFSDPPPQLFCPNEPVIRDQWCQRFPESEPWLATFDAITNLASKITSRLDSGSNQGDDVLLWTNVLVHRLVSIRPLSDALLETCRLGLLLFIAAIYRNYGAHPTNTRILVNKMKKTLDKKIKWGTLWGLELWILCISAFEARAMEGDGLYFVEKIVEIKKTLPESSTMGMIDAIKTLGLWIPQLFDEKGRNLALKVDTNL